jgi:hypothetical protein
MKGLTEMSVDEFDPALEKAFNEIYERSDENEHDIIDMMFLVITLQSAQDCKNFPEESKPKDMERFGMAVTFVQRAFDEAFAESSIKDKEVLYKAKEQIKKNGPALCENLEK